jgi:predicted Ser/Thr protein kinase
MRACPKCGSTYPDNVQYCPLDGSGMGPQLSSGDGDPRVGTLIDRYRLVEKLGEGGMGMVYKAEHTMIGRPVALKLLHPDLARVPQAVDRFFREARAANEIPSDHIVQVTDFGRAEDGANFLVMEFLEGVDLQQVLTEEKRFTPQRAAQIAMQIAEGVGAAHKRKVIHRDLKPGNVQLVQRGANAEFVKIMDFGIAKITESGTQLTKTGMILGSPAYMSPEQASGQPVDPRTDIYALGVIIYEMLVGRPPFIGQSPTQILLAHVTQVPEPPRTLNADVPEPLEQLVLQCLSKEPDKRPASMEQVRDRLRSWLEGGDAAAAGLGLASTAYAPVTEPPPAGVPAAALATGPGATPASVPDATPASVPPAAVATGVGATSVPPGDAVTLDDDTLGTQAAPPRPASKLLWIAVAGGAVALAAVGVTAFLLFGNKDTATTTPVAAAGSGASAWPAQPAASAAFPDAATTVASGALEEKDPDTAEPAPQPTEKPEKPRPIEQPRPTEKPRPVEKFRQPHPGAPKARGPELRPVAARPLSTAKKPAPTPEPPPLPKPETPARALLQSVPRGAAVYKGSRYWGRTPLAIPTSVPVQLTLRMQGYQPYTLTVPARSGPLNVRLMPEIPEYKRTRSFSRIDMLQRAGRITAGQAHARKYELGVERTRRINAVHDQYRARLITRRQKKDMINAIKQQYR